MKLFNYITTGWRIAALFWLFVGICLGWIIVVTIDCLVNP